MFMYKTPEEFYSEDNLKENIVEKETSLPSAIEEEPKYGEILYDQTKTFHGVGFDIGRLKGILDRGIVSEQSAQKEGYVHTRNYGGYNLQDSVSVAESPSKNNTFDYGCFKVYIKNGISFVIDNQVSYKAPKGSPQDSGYADEAFIKDKVDRENIVGIMVPVEFLDTPLKDMYLLNLEKMGLIYINNRCKKILQDLQSETGYVADVMGLEQLIKKREELETQEMGYLEKWNKEKEIVEEMERLMSQHISQAYSEKLQIENPTLRDILKIYVPEDLKVYSSDGHVVDLK